MRRKYSFEKLGKVLVLLGSAFHAGCVVLVAQVMCVLMCLQGVTIDGTSTPKDGGHCHVLKSGDIAKSECHTPSTTDLMLLSHVAGDWAMEVELPLAAMPQARFEVLSKKPDMDVPDLSLPSPPPKSSVLS